MFSNFVNFELVNKSLGRKRFHQSFRSITLKYPCENTSICTPYELQLEKGSYIIECWGARGTRQQEGENANGAYTKGNLLLTKDQNTFYVYIGASGFFNSAKNIYYAFSAFPGGGATDLRINDSKNWFDTSSLISRVMVAAGGGGAEWGNARGGYGGGINGGESHSCDLDANIYEEPCPGASQTSGSICPEYDDSTSYPGSFGSAGVVTSERFGGFGGGGYYGGSSYSYAYAGSGGSSFISGHKGCDSVKNNTLKIEHTGFPYHYSGIIFQDTFMIPGNE